jgi:hypothetical protein
MLLRASGRIILGDWANEGTHYLGLGAASAIPPEEPQAAFGDDLQRRWKGTISLEQFSAEQRVNVLNLIPANCPGCVRSHKPETCLTTRARLAGAMSRMRKEVTGAGRCSRKPNAGEKTPNCVAR